MSNVAKSKYNPDYHDDWAWSLAIHGATDQEIADAFKINRATFHRWRDRYESLKNAVTIGKESADARVLKSMYKRATGYSYDEVEKIIEHGTDGRPTLVRTKVITKHVPADVGAGAIWSKNRADWRDRPEERKLLTLKEKQCELQNRKLELEIELASRLTESVGTTKFDELIKELMLSKAGDLVDESIHAKAEQDIK